MSFEAIPNLLADLLHEQRLTRDAIITLAEAIAGARAKSAETVKAAKPEASEEKPVAAAQSVKAPAPTAQTATPETVESPSEPEQAAEVAVSVADLNAAIIGLAKSKGREAAVAVLTQFGAAKVPELKPSQYADVLAAVKAAAA
jgi:hypothetical protein